MSVKTMNHSRVEYDVTEERNSPETLTLVTMTTTKFFSSILYSFSVVSLFRILPVTLKEKKSLLRIILIRLFNKKLHM